MRNRKHRTAFLFLAPVILVLVALNLYPIISTVWLSFQDLNLLRSARATWGGLSNYVELLTNDDHFWQVVINTGIWVFGSSALQLVAAFAIALLLNTRILARKFVRTLVLTPWITPIIVVGVAWRWILNPEWGLLNYYFLQWGIIDSPVTWLYNPATVWPVLLLASVWKGAPFMAIMLLAGLQAVPRQLYESARVDGASAAQLFRYVTVPTMLPVIAIVTLIATMETWNNFRMIWVLTEGGPGYTTTVMSVFIYFKSFQDFNLGEGAALAVISAVVVSILAFFYIRFRARQGAV